MSIKEDQIIEEDDVVVEEEEIVEDSNNPEEPEIDQDEDEEDDRIVTIGEAPSEEEEEEDTTDGFTGKPAPQFVKTLRKSNRKKDSEIRRLKRQLEENQKVQEAEKPIELGEKPTLSKCNFDDKKFEQKLIEYHDRRKKVEEQAANKVKAAEAQNEAYRNRQEVYVAKRKEHSFKDFMDTEELVTETLSETQQGIIVQGSEDSALLVYALGKNPKKLAELAKITDPITFAFTVAKLESQLKVTNKRVPTPETRVTSGKAGGISGNSDKALERLRDEAAKTGDYTKVSAYKNKLRKEK